MSTKDEALKLALEGLEKWHFDKDPRGAADYITAIREALADSALDRMAENARELGLDYEPAQQLTDEKGRPLKFWGGKAEQPARQPVAWMFQHEETGRTMCVDAQQVELGFEKGNPRLKKIAPLYTSPPASKPWVGLTQEDMYEIGEFKNTHGYVPTGFKRLAAAIEAKLREKNA